MEEADMAQGAVDVTIDAAPDAVWAKIGDFGALEEIFPGIESCRVEGDERIIGTGGGGEIRERLLARDEATRTLTYTIVEGVPVERHEATITVEPVGDGSKVTWAYDVEPAEMATAMGGSYQGALASLQGLFT
jgi:carbon monoxide dehydrogenase subunit G